jgi:hypothetical protein
VVQTPQWERSFWVSTQEPLQSVSPEGQPPPLQEPPLQTWPEVQALPQLPQWLKSEARMTQTPPHGS